MIVPAAMFIEIASDQVQKLDRAQLLDQLKELGSAIGPARATEQIQAGYLLGLQTARVLLQGMPAAVFNKVSI
jgi:hypothetical protein